MTLLEEHLFVHVVGDWWIQWKEFGERAIFSPKSGKPYFF